MRGAVDATVRASVVVTVETLRYPEIGVRVTGSAMFFHFAMTSSTLPGRPSRFPGVDTSLPVEELRVRVQATGQTGWRSE